VPIHAHELESMIDQCMLHERPRFRRRTRAEAVDPRLAADIQRSIDLCAARRAAVGPIRFPEELPIAARRAEIAAVIAAHQVVILCGETGSGKTTQLPKICLELGRGVYGLIGHTQPRRIAARSVAARIAFELDSPLGELVGFKIRFNDRLGPRTLVKLMTDGILLAELQGDRDLLRYDTLIIDEAHERSLNIDYLLGYLKRLLPERPDLKVIITSATIDPERFSSHFNGAPIIEVSGRTYPVETRYHPVIAEEADEEDPTVLAAILDAVDEVCREGPGDILVFLSGEREIRETAEAIGHRRGMEALEVLPLYARLSAEEQMRVFQPHAGRRIVLATNVAETSLTVPGIRYVIDPGFARISRYSPRTKVQRLPIEPISRASADQRRGRCGRVRDGVCIRLYAQDDYDARPAFTDPEILRTNLASVILQMKAMRLGDVEQFPFLQPPESRRIRDGYETLHELGAIDAEKRLTSLGRELARLPIDPRLGRMILAARAERCLPDVLVIAAALSVQDPRDRPMEGRHEADESHRAFRDERSDFLAFLKLWEFVREQSAQQGSSRWRRTCRERFLSFLRLREWGDVHAQLREIVSGLGWPLDASARAGSDSAAIHRAILSGLLSSVGRRDDAFEYTAARGAKFHLHPASGLFRKPPRWVVVAELVETTRLYARIAAEVQPQWIERAGRHLLRRTHTNPRWDAREARVIADEKASLFDLVVVPRRRVHYGPIDPRASRDIFIQSALVEGEYHTQAPFARHNRNLGARLARLEAKARSPDLVADAQARFDFYDARIPQGIYSGGQFESWRRDIEHAEPNRLFMTEADLLLRPAPEVTPVSFPDEWLDGSLRLGLNYRYDPGAEDDGLTVTIPLALLGQVDARAFDWMVPGLRAEKIESLIRSLPKHLRVHLSPVRETAHAATAALDPRGGSLFHQLSRHLHRAFGVDVPPEAWRTTELPPHLQARFVVVSDQGDVVAAGRDLPAIQRAMREAVRRDLRQASDHEWKRAGITRWDFGTIPETVELVRSGSRILAFPALVDRGDSAALTLLDSRRSARCATRGGLQRLLMIRLRQELADLIEQLPAIESMRLFASSLVGGRSFDDDLGAFIVDRSFLDSCGEVRDEDAFEARLNAGWPRMWSAGLEAAAIGREILETRQRVALDLDRLVSTDPAPVDVQGQLHRLVPPGFLVATPRPWLPHVPRFLSAIESRLRKLRGGGAARDSALTARVAPFWQRCIEALAAGDALEPPGEALVQYRWMVEEFRVSLFSPELKTSMPVSEARLERQWALAQSPAPAD
jgi:ATP-dependent helicase HrpA